MTLLNEIRRRLPKGCIDKRIVSMTKGNKRATCRVAMDDAPRPSLIVNLDQLERHQGTGQVQGQKHGDYFVVVQKCVNSFWLVVIEIKGGKYSPSHLIDQIQAGAKVAEQYVLTAEKVTFCPIAVTRRMDKNDRRELLAGVVKFHGFKKHVVRLSCGERLVDALKPGTER